MSPFKSVKGRALGKLLEGYQTSTLGQGFGSGDGGGGGGGGITDIATLNTSARILWGFCLMKILTPLVVVNIYTTMVRDIRYLVVMVICTI